MSNPASNLRSRKKGKKKAKLVAPKRPYNCDLCRYSTDIQSRMVMHIVRTHLSEKRFSCHICRYRTSERFDLKQHLRVHVGTNPFECKVCDFITGQVNIFEIHLKMHTKELPYGCDQCEFKSTDQSGLLAHLKSHDYDNDLCFLCDNRDATLKAFNAKRKGCRLCRLHTCACFNLTTLHLCSWCQKDCMERWRYRRTTIHITNNSKLFYNYVKGVLTCSICARTFKAKIGYFSHMQSHLKTSKCSGESNRESTSNICR